MVKNLGDLSGKIVIDPTNPYKRSADGLAEHTVATSAGELIQGWLPKAYVVKAFNTLTFLTMADPATPEGKAMLERRSPLNSADKIRTGHDTRRR